eukprot:NODE_761_length_4121_cov_0.819741.p4 type:complete len:114 gc:universal NODE_761_length_4121_cov_0.819741:3114-2773(-)
MNAANSPKYSEPSSDTIRDGNPHFEQYLINPMHVSLAVLFIIGCRSTQPENMSLITQMYRNSSSSISIRSMPTISFTPWGILNFICTILGRRFSLQYSQSFTNLMINLSLLLK